MLLYCGLTLLMRCVAACLGGRHFTAVIIELAQHARRKRETRMFETRTLAVEEAIIFLFFSSWETCSDGNIRQMLIPLVASSVRAMGEKCRLRFRRILLTTRLSRPPGVYP